MPPSFTGQHREKEIIGHFRVGMSEDRIAWELHTLNSFKELIFLKYQRFSLPKRFPKTTRPSCTVKSGNTVLKGGRV